MAGVEAAGAGQRDTRAGLTQPGTIGAGNTLRITASMYRRSLIIVAERTLSIPHMSETKKTCQCDSWREAVRTSDRQRRPVETHKELS